MTALTDSKQKRRYWRTNLRLISILLAIWIIVTFVPTYFAKELSEYVFLGWPFPFWAAAFGAPTVFLLIVGIYAWRMERLDRQTRSQGLINQNRSQT
jgi:putative solute:sodium symporter small subunit